MEFGHIADFEEEAIGIAAKGVGGEIAWMIDFLISLYSFLKE